MERLFTQGPVDLALRCSRDGRSYTLGLRQGPEVDYATLRAEDLADAAPPVGAAFAGVMFGVYAFGRGEPVLDHADFMRIRVVDGASGEDE